MIRYAKLCVPVPLKSNFTYSFDSDKLDVKPGIRVRVPFGSANRKITGYVIDVSDSLENQKYEVKSIIDAIDKEPIFDNREYELALWMEHFYFSSRGIVLDTMIPGGKRDTSFGALDAEEALPRRDVVLSDEQSHAVRSIMDSSLNLFYVFGITGSGKTEVFLHCAEEAIAKGGQVIYLVPEITLTHQLALQVLKRFQDKVAILHSGLTDSQRIAQWRRIKRGEVSLAIGARSAVFAPFENLSMIIIDEEHENSYKSGQDPRYHARQVAQKRIQDCNGKLIMGSATPSLEAWSIMKDPSRILRLDLTRRLGGGSLPEVEIADMTKDDTIIGSVLQNRMYETLSAGKQVILFLNRRGFSYYFHCTSCGYELKCPHCDVALTYHKKTGRMVCHYCGYTQKPVSCCPECGSRDIMYSGYGTEQVEQAVSTMFPSFNVARLDTDTAAKSRKVVTRTLDDFRTGKTHILIGTQMVAKGLNFPNVQLVGIINADSGLLLPDFRAEERTFDLIVQVAGRSGRADDKGKVVIQTRIKDNPAISLASQNKVQAFFDDQLKLRKDTGFPPFSRMINIVFRSTDPKSAKGAAEAVAADLRKNSEGLEVFGASECPIEKINRYYRFQVLLRGRNMSRMIRCVQTALDHCPGPYNVITEVDVDPTELM